MQNSRLQIYFADNFEATHTLCSNFQYCCEKSNAILFLPPEQSVLFLYSILGFHINYSVQFSSVTQSCPTLRPHELQHSRPPCPSPTPGVHPNSYASSRWRHPAISSSVVPFSSCPQSLPASESCPTSQLFAWGSQSIGVSGSASVPPMNTQDWSPLGRTGKGRQFLNGGVCVIIYWLVQF